MRFIELLLNFGFYCLWKKKRKNINKVLNIIFFYLDMLDINYYKVITCVKRNRLNIN